MNDDDNNNNTSAKPGKILVSVSDNEASRLAVLVACRKAKPRGNVVDLLMVLEPAEFQPMFGVGDRMDEEQRENAETVLQEMAAFAQEQTGVTPTFTLREGNVGESIIATTLEDSDINLLIIGLQADSDRGSRLAAYLSSKLGDSLLVPMMIVPENLTDQQLEALL